MRKLADRVIIAWHHNCLSYAICCIRSFWNVLSGQILVFSLVELSFIYAREENIRRHALCAFKSGICEKCKKAISGQKYWTLLYITTETEVLFGFIYTMWRVRIEIVVTSSQTKQMDIENLTRLRSYGVFDLIKWLTCSIWI